MRRSGAVLAGAAIIGLLAGCAGSGGYRLPSPLPTDVPFAYHLQTTSGSDGALLEGTLELQGGCLVVLQDPEGFPEPPPPVVPVVPVAVSSWDGTTFTVDGESAAIGEVISLGGGYSGMSDPAFLPAGCPGPVADGYFTVGIG